MEDIEKDTHKNSETNSKEKNEILEPKIQNNEILKQKIKNNEILEKKIDKFCHYFREQNKQIEDVDKWQISDFFGINDLERIKQTPEYIIEKIFIHFKNFINLNDYFFIMNKNEKKNQNQKNQKKK